MPAEALLIAEPAIDFTTFLGMSSKALGYSPASAADASHKKLSNTEKFLSCLAALRDKRAPAGITLNLLSHASFSILVIAEEEDLLDILECASEMSFVRAPTVMRGIEIAIVSGTLAKWRDAVKCGMNEVVEPPVRLLWTKVMTIFERLGLASVWSDSTKKPSPDSIGFLLEDKRK